MEPTKKDVLDLADYLGCNGGELWSEVSKLLEKQDTYARIDELLGVRNVDSQLSSADIVEHVETRLELLRSKS